MKSIIRQEIFVILITVFITTVVVAIGIFWLQQRNIDEDVLEIEEVTVEGTELTEENNIE